MWYDITADTWTASLRFAVPGLCYFVNNNVFYLVLEYFDPAGATAYLCG